MQYPLLDRLRTRLQQRSMISVGVAKTILPEDQIVGEIDPARSPHPRSRDGRQDAGRHLGRQVKLRAAGITTLRIVSLFNKDLRGLLQVAPDYMKPVNYDSRKLQSVLGPQQMTSYNDGIGRTLAWIASR
jgi:hypothetical protein